MNDCQKIISVLAGRECQHKYQQWLNTIDEFVETPIKYHKGSLFHFTNHQGAMGILESNELWLTNIYRQSDKKEICHGISIALESLRQSADLTRDYDCCHLVKRIEKVTSCYTKFAQIFLSCFSRDNSEQRMWREYADDQKGYCLEFSSIIQENFHQYPTNDNGTESNGVPLILSVIYGKQEFIQIIEFIISHTISLCKLLCRNARLAGHGSADALKCIENCLITPLLQFIVTYSVGYKSPLFVPENEIRFLRSVRKNAQPRNVQKNSRNVEYMTWKIDPPLNNRSLIGIKIGQHTPQKNIDELYNRLRSNRYAIENIDMRRA